MGYGNLVLYANCNFVPGKYDAWIAAYKVLEKYVFAEEPYTKTYYFGTPENYGVENRSKTTHMFAYEVYRAREDLYTTHMNSKPMTEFFPKIQPLMPTGLDLTHYEDVSGFLDKPGNLKECEIIWDTRLRVKPEKRDAILEKLAGLAKWVEANEPGAYSFLVHKATDKGREGEIRILERYATRAALEAHQSAKEVLDFFFSNKDDIIQLENHGYLPNGYLLGWWDVHPLPGSTPAPYNNAHLDGRISAWGYGIVEESTYDSLPVGSLVLVSLHRAKLMPVYNEYLTFTPEQAGQLSQERKGWGSLMLVMFLTEYLLNRFVFASDEKSLVPPASDTQSYTAEDANIQDAVVIITAASGKNALLFAHQLNNARSDGSKRRKIIAVTSPSSKSFVEGKSESAYTGLTLYDDVSGTNLSSAIVNVVDSETKVVLCDFGAPLKPRAKSLIALGVGSEPKVSTQEELMQGFVEGMALGRVQANASDMLHDAIKVVGGEAFWKEFLERFDAFIDGGGIPGLKLVVGKGMGAVGKGWERLCSDGISAQEGLVFDI
ncbi:hypothetical protein AJ80_03832 [Polytolypa hystricis UAMH7299]|uniref:ABM domain-containing protein n=1 Tax=Polytolypa hystricis (strain UAMH7299) TaxID=1447883 RepID=A0A2B7YGE7_POLH7|nr:hypothetical protein AJ80_03832 [Polytolypa hystricis UAMH7299]